MAHFLKYQIFELRLSYTKGLLQVSRTMKLPFNNIVTNNRIPLNFIILFSVLFLFFTIDDVDAVTLQWNTFLGGTGSDESYTIALDENGNIYIAGISSATWGTPVNEYTANDILVAKLDNNGNLLWNTFLGGDGYVQPMI